MLHTYVDIVVVCTIASLLVSWARQHRSVRQFAKIALGDLPSDSRDGVLAVCSAVHSGIRRRQDDRSFVAAPILRALGASPGGIIHEGGCCSGKSRLAIVAYGHVGLRAAQVTLYHQSGRAQHCAVEVVYRDGPMIVDPMYGIFYVTEDGEPVGLDALRRGVTPVFRPIPGSARTSYPADPYYDFDYRRTRTANWTATAFRRHVHRCLSHLTRGRIDTLRQPAALEWPQLVLSAALGVMFALAHLLVRPSDDSSAIAVTVSVLRLTLPGLIIAGAGGAAMLTWSRGWSTRVAQRDSGP